MIVEGYEYIVVDWFRSDCLQVETPAWNYRVAHTRDPYEALCRILVLEGVVLHARVRQVSSWCDVDAGYVAYYYDVVD